MTDIKILEDAVKIAVQEIVARHKERFIQQAVAEYERAVRKHVAEAADLLTTIIRSEYKDEVTIQMQLVFKAKQ